MTTLRNVPIDTVINWVRGYGPGDAKDIVPMYFKGLCNRSVEGQVGFDVKCRPVSMGQGEYTVTVGGSDVELPS